MYNVGKGGEGARSSAGDNPRKRNESSDGQIRDNSEQLIIGSRSQSLQLAGEKNFAQQDEVSFYFPKFSKSDDRLKLPPEFPEAPEVKTLSLRGFNFKPRETALVEIKDAAIQTEAELSGNPSLEEARFHAEATQSKSNTSPANTEEINEKPRKFLNTRASSFEYAVEKLAQAKNYNFQQKQVAEVERLNAKLWRIQQENVKLKDELSRFDLENQQLTSENKTFLTRNSNAQTKADYDGLFKKNAELVNSHTKLELDYAYLVQEYDVLTQRLTSKVGELDGLKASNTKLLAIKKSMIQQLRTAKSSRVQHEVDYEKKILMLRNKLISIQDELQAKLKVLDEVAERESLQLQQLRDGQRQINLLNTQIDEFSAKQNKSVEEIRKLHKLNNDLNKEKELIPGLNQQILELTATINTLNSQLEQFTSIAAEKEEALRRNRQYEGQVANLEGHNREYLAKNRQLQAELDIAVHNYTQLNQCCEILEDKVKELMQEKEELEKKLAIKQPQINKSEFELEKQNIELVLEVRRLNKVISDLQTQLICGEESLNEPIKLK